jgi:hypothetical protein
MTVQAREARQEILVTSRRRSRDIKGGAFGW